MHVQVNAQHKFNFFYFVPMIAHYHFPPPYSSERRDKPNFISFSDSFKNSKFLTTQRYMTTRRQTTRTRNGASLETTRRRNSDNFCLPTAFTCPRPTGRRPCLRKEWSYSAVCLLASGLLNFRRHWFSRAPRSSLPDRSAGLQPCRKRHRRRGNWTPTASKCSAWGRVRSSSSSSRHDRTISVESTTASLGCWPAPCWIRPCRHQQSIRRPLWWRRPGCVQAEDQRPRNMPGTRTGPRPRRRVCAHAPRPGSRGESGDCPCLETQPFSLIKGETLITDTWRVVLACQSASSTKENPCAIWNWNSTLAFLSGKATRFIAAELVRFSGQQIELSSLANLRSSVVP